MRNAILIAVCATLAALPASRAQAPAPTSPVAAARRLLDGHLAALALRRVRCVSPAFANCPGGLQVVHGYSLGRAVQRGDTVRFAVEFYVAGVVASSEASLMFLPSDSGSSIDSGEVVVVRRGRRWVAGESRPPSAPVRTSTATARRFFAFEADERHVLDSAIAAYRRR